MMQVIRLVPSSGFSMAQAALEGVGRGDLIQDLNTMEEVRAAERPLHIVPASGTWNFLPTETTVGALGMLDQAYEVYGSFDGISVVFDCTGEGFRWDPIVHQALADKLQQYGLTRERAFMLTSRLQPDKGYLEWCAIYKQTPAITPLSTPIQLYYYAGSYLRAADETYMRRRIAERWPMVGPLRPKRFLCLNNMPREARWTTMASLIDAGVLDEGHVSFHGFDAFIAAGEAIPTLEQIQSEMRQYKVPEHIIDRVPTVLARMPMRLPEPAKGRFDMAYDVADQPYWGEVYFTILTESDFPGHAGARFSEKVLKPFANLLPFVVVAPPGVLKELQRLGFQTFGDVIDESYDDMEDPGDRLNASVKEAVRLASMNLEELHALYVKVWPRLVHNFTHFLSLTPTLAGLDTAFASLAPGGTPPESPWAPLDANWTYRHQPQGTGGGPIAMKTPGEVWEYGHFSEPMPAPANERIIRLDIEPVEGQVGVSLMTPDGSTLLTREAVLRAGAERRQLHFQHSPASGPARILFRNYDAPGRGGQVTLHRIEIAGPEGLAPFTEVFERTGPAAT